MTTAVLISGDHLAWQGLRAYARAHHHLHILVETRHPAQALEVARRRQPDLALIATDLDGATLLPLVRELRACCPHASIVLLGVPRPPDEQRELAALEVSASLGWEHLMPEILPHVLAVVRAGLLVGDRPALANLLEYDVPAHAPTEPLPPPEWMILQHLAHGLTVQEIARVERLAPRQVDRHMASLKARLGVSTLFTLALAAVQRGYVVPGAWAASSA